VGNTVGRSFILLRKNKYMIQLTHQEEAVFLGNLLGDGHIQKRGNSFRTKISHPISQKEYVFWKYDQLKRLCDQTMSPKRVVANRTLKSAGMQEQSYLFYLNSGMYLKKYHDLFYKPYIWRPNSTKPGTTWLDIDSDYELKKGEKIRYKKVITESLIEYFNESPYLLAVWFLDDGSRRTDCFSGRFATQGFSKSEQHLLKRYLEQVFNIRSQIVLHNRLKDQYYLSIPSKNGHFARLTQIIEPIVNQIPSMSYKIKDPRND
jgi:hypothetical protein